MGKKIELNKKIFIAIIIGAIIIALVVIFYLTNVSRGYDSFANVQTNSSQNTLLINQSTETQSNSEYCGDGTCNNNETCSACEADCGKCQLTSIDEVRNIAVEYHRTHTYSLTDFFVCSDMAIDTWNLIKTVGINAKICAGNIDINLTGETYKSDFSQMNHAWVLAEVEPFTYIAVETTGGYLVWGNSSITNETDVKNQLYYQYARYCFETPAKFKKFSDLRTSYLTVCSEADSMRNYWNENIVGTTMTYSNQEYKGRMNAKIDECNGVINQLNGLLT
jgi:hypothetical protein